MLLASLGGIAIAAIVYALLGLSAWIWSPIATLIRFVCALVILSMGVFGVITAEQAHRDGWTSIFLFGTFLCALAVLLIVRLYRTRRGKALTSSANGVETTSPMTTTDAWSDVMRHMTWGERRQCRDSRSKIDAFLAEQESLSLTVEHRQLVVTIRQRLPQLREECLTRCNQATPAERRQYLKKLSATLADLARSADRARGEIRTADDRKLDALHGYFASVSKSGS